MAKTAFVEHQAPASPVAGDANKEWCITAARCEGDCEVGAGPLACSHERAIVCTDGEAIRIWSCPDCGKSKQLQPIAGDDAATVHIAYQDAIVRLETRLKAAVSAAYERAAKVADTRAKAMRANGSSKMVDTKMYPAEPIAAQYEWARADGADDVAAAIRALDKAGKP